MIERAASAASAVERTALKEWSVLVEAMARGELIAMVRKGGIREQRAGFDVRHDRFLLYPTRFHEKAPELAPRFAPALGAAPPTPHGVIRLEYVCDVAAVWWVTELDRLRAVEDEQGLAWPAIESRFHYRSRPGVHLIAVRVSRLERAAELPELRRYGGCVSWVELDGDVRVDRALPVVPDENFRARLGRLRAALGPDARAAAV